MTSVLAVVAVATAMPRATPGTSASKLPETVSVPLGTAIPAGPAGVEAIPGSVAIARLPGAGKAASSRAPAKKSPVAKSPAKTASGTPATSMPSPTATAIATVPASGGSGSGGTGGGGTGGGGGGSGSGGSGSGGGTSASGALTAGDSKANCISPHFPSGVVSQSIIDGISASTHVAYNCLNTFNNPMPAWDDWDNPWMFRVASDGWDAWLADSPRHQVILGMDLIPQAIQDTSDPLTWEQSCASGAYDQYATTLARNLVSDGAGSVIMRMGIEANGSWEADYVGTTSTEMSDWAKCYDNEVTAMRAVAGTHFLFVWNPNVCTADIPLSRWYPGNAYVDIIGADAYDKDCQTGETVAQEGWAAYASDSASGGSSDPDFPSLDNLEAFAVAHGKPLSIPEWGLRTGDDDPAYVDGLARMFQSDDFAYQDYFNSDDAGIATLGPDIPDATAAYAAGFR